MTKIAFATIGKNQKIPEFLSILRLKIQKVSQLKKTFILRSNTHVANQGFLYFKPKRISKRSIVNFRRSEPTFCRKIVMIFVFLETLYMV